MVRFQSYVCMVLVTAHLMLAQNVNKPAPQFRATTSTGEEISLTDFRNKVVLLNFWASWCAPCRKELPFLIDLFNDSRDSNLVVLAINIDDKAENMKKFFHRLKKEASFPIIMDPRKEIPPKYNLQTMPTTILIDHIGLIRYRHSGFRNSTIIELRQEIQFLLNEKRRDQ